MTKIGVSFVIDALFSYCLYGAYQPNIQDKRLIFAFLEPLLPKKKKKTWLTVVNQQPKE